MVFLWFLQLLKRQIFPTGTDENDKTLSVRDHDLNYWGGGFLIITYLKQNYFIIKDYYAVIKMPQ